MNKYVYIYIQVLSLIIIIKKIFKKNKTIVVQNMYFHIWVYCSVIREIIKLKGVWKLRIMVFSLSDKIIFYVDIWNPAYRAVMPCRYFNSIILFIERQMHTQTVHDIGL